MVKKNFLVVFLALISLHAGVYGQDIRVTARVDSNTILIGDWLTLYIDVEHPGDMAVKWPVVPDTLEGFEVIHRNTPSVKNNGRNTLESTTFVITAFDSGVHVIPPLMFHYSAPGDTSSRSAATSPIPVFVRGIAVDTTGEIKDVKPPLNVPISFAEILPYLIGVAGIGGVLWLIYYITKKRKKGEKLIPEAPPRPSHEIALEALRALDAEHLWQRGKVKEYYSRLTDIVRTYIEQRFGILAMEMTTDEILSSPVVTETLQESMTNLKELLVRSDFVKFAKLQPPPAENEASLSLAVAYVENTSSRVPAQVAAGIDEEVNA